MRTETETYRTELKKKMDEFHITKFNLHKINCTQLHVNIEFLN